MSGGRKLVYYVVARDENGAAQTFGPDSESIPAWALTAITNPKVWDDYDPDSAGGSAKRDEDEQPEVKPYAKWVKADLEAEVEKRNDARDEDDLIVVEGKGTVKDLAAALDADDAAGA